MKRSVLLFIVIFIGLINADMNEGLLVYFPFNGNTKNESRNGTYSQDKKTRKRKILMKDSDKHEIKSTPAITKSNGMLQITIDPRLELLAVIQYLSDSKMVSKGGSYADAIDAWFLDYKNHPVIDVLKKIESLGYNHDLPVSSFLRFTDISFSNISYNWDASSEEMNLKRLETISESESIEKFYNLVGDFALISNFSGFFTSQSEFYLKRANDAVDVLSQHPDMITHIVDWYGYSYGSYTLVISPLAIGGYGPALVDAEGGIHSYCVVDIDFSNITDSSLRQISSWFFHEFSHSYVNPLVKKHWNIFESGEQNFKNIKVKMEKQSYGSWWITVAEHFVRANDIRLTESYYNIESKSSLQNEISKGFIFITAIYETLQQYELQHRQNSIDYASFFPTIAQNFMERTEISEKDLHTLLRFKGSMNSVFQEDDVLIIYPDPNRVKGVEEYIMPTVEWLSSKGYEAVTDQTALKMDISKRNLCLYGAWGSNLILENFSKKIPFEIQRDKIIGDKIYKGNQLRIAFCYPNPLNPEKAMNVYTAQTTPSMKNSNAIFHGPEDWYISNIDLEVLGFGNFKNKDKDWSFQAE